MQTFMPFPDFKRSLEQLDPKRLGNQVYREGKTLVNGGWSNHPASKMWRGYEYALCEYCLKGLEVLASRNRFYPHWVAYFIAKQLEFPNTGMPPWMGDDRVHSSHRAALYYKDKEYYKHFAKDAKKHPMSIVKGKEKFEYYWATGES